MELYGYSCGNGSMALSITPDMFVCHADSAPAGAAAPQRHVANSGSVAEAEKLGVALRQPGQVAALSAVVKCAVAVALRDIEPGEEILEDYRT